MVIFAAVLLLFSIAGNFPLECLAVQRRPALCLRFGRRGTAGAGKKTHPQAEAFRLPHGMLIAGLALLFTGVLMTRMCLGELIVISITTALAFVTGCGHGSR